MFAASNRIAIASESTTLTYNALTHHISRRKKEIGNYVVFSGYPTLDNIITLFAAFEKGSTIFPQNFRLPYQPELDAVPNVATLLLTSGSTGKPKVACHTLDNYLANASTMLSPLALSEESRYLLSLPLYHVAGLAILFRTFLAGATLVLSDTLPFTHCSLVPAQLNKVTFPKEIQCILLGGGPIPSNLNHKKLPLRISYGLTEMTSTVLLDDTLLPKRELKLAPDGEILVRGPSLFAGYLGKKQEGWFATGDLAKQTAPSRYQILGRKDNMFISGGENIQPEEIEIQLTAIDGIEEAIVVPKEDPEFGSRPVAFIKGDISLEELREQLSSFLPAYKLPVDFLPLPPSQGLKPSRMHLRSLISSKNQ